MTQHPFGRAKIWVAFQGELKAKAVSKSDLDYFQEMTEREDDYNNLPEWVEELFQAQERLEMGSVPALHEAITICTEAQIPLPAWLEEQVKRLVVCQVTGESFEVVSRGRANSETARMREELKLYVRKEAVQGVRRYQALEPCVFGFLFLPVGLKRLYHGKKLPDLGTTIEQAIHHASLGLRGSFAQASEETIRKAYFAKNESGWGPWIWSRQDTLEAMGVSVQNMDYMPEGYTFNDFPSDDLDSDGPIDLPSPIFSGFVKKQLDPVSSRYLDAVQDWDDIDQFFDVQRAKRHAK